ncbi:MAG: hypothetical protein AAF206_19620 [Bacteroidota bacterium]
MKEIEALLKERDFAHLTAAEKKLVRTEMSEAEYVRMRAVITGVQALTATEKPLVPREHIRTQVRAHMRTQSQNGLGNGLSRWLRYRIPAYQAAAAVVVLAFALHWFGNRLPGNVPQPGFSGEIMFADTTGNDSSRQGVSLYEDSVFARFMREAY